jgi:hypothetical protein
MSENIQQTEPAKEVLHEQKTNDKEYNFAQLRKQLADSEAAREKAEKERDDAKKRRASDEVEDEPYGEPYIDDKRLNKKLERFEEKIKKELDELGADKARQFIEKEKQESFLKANPDFTNLLQPEMIRKFSERYPEVAEQMLELPPSFARQKLLYQNIKALGLHKPEEKPPSIQETIDKNRRSPYYQPSGVGNTPYAAAGDFSPAGQKNAYQKMQELKNRLRI